MSSPSTADSTAGVAPIEILVFGEFSIRGIGGHGLGQTEGRTHVRALLALTAAYPQGVQRDEIADALWPRLGVDAARNRLHHTTHLARQALDAIAWPDEWIHLNHGRLQLDPRVSSDAHRIVRLMQTPLETASELDLLTAIEQYRGDWAPGIDAGGLGAAVRHQFHQAYVTLLKEAARRRIADGDVPARRHFLERLIEINPAEELPYQQLMQLDLDRGRHHAVLRRFEAASSVFSQRLGLRPSRALAEIAAAAANRISPGGRLQNCNAAGGDMLIDRESLVREILAAIEAESGIWNVHGLSGVGKTALMREVMRRAGAMLPDGVVYLSMGDGLGASIAETVCLTLGIEPESELSTQAGLELMLTSREMLIVLDDFDARLEGAALLASLPGYLRSRVVAITHVPLSVPAIRHVAVHPLRVPDAQAPLVQARLAPAIVFYRMRRPVADVYDWTAQHWSEVIALVRKLDGLPLAIELAAAKSYTMTAGEILAQLEATANDSGATASFHDGNYLHGPVGSALALSVRLLGAQTRTVLLGSAALPDWFAPQEAAAVARAAGLADDAALRVCLDELADAGLLERDNDHFRMLHLTRHYARREASYAGSWSRICRTRIGELVRRMGEGACDIEAPGYTHWMERVRSLHDEALPLLDEAQAEDPALFLALLVPLMHSWSVRGLQPLGLRWGQVGIVVAEAAGNVEALIAARVMTATLLLDGRHLNDALAHTEAALETLRIGAGDAIAPVLRAQLAAVHAQAIAGSRPLAEVVAFIDVELTAIEEPGQAGWWTLQTARMSLVQSVSIPQPAGILAVHWPFDACRARLAGSLTWCELLAVLSRGVPGITPQQRVALCDEMLECARDLRAPRAAHAALNHKASAQMALGKRADAETTVIEWYRLARATGRDTAATHACLRLAEIAWRSDDANACGPWMDAARKLVATLAPSHPMRVAVALHEMVIDALRGALDSAIARFVTLPIDIILTARRDSMEQLVEAAALLAGKARLENLAKTLSQYLGVLTDAKENVPLVKEFRARHLASAPTIRGDSLADVEQAVERTRRDLAILHEYWGLRP